jgi:predicted lipoprotein with Yx(FWY)xxD motif
VKRRTVPARVAVLQTAGLNLAVFSAVAVGLLAPALPAAAAPLGETAPQVGAVVDAVSSPTYGSVLVVGGEFSSDPVAGYTLYEISSDAGGKFGCTTRVASGYDFPQDGTMAESCTGPESAAVNSSNSVDWPAFTTTGKPLAGPGVKQKLLGSVYRPGIGYQVTYGGHPLYLFDAPASLFAPQGEGYFETAAPLLPWHGLWDVVSSQGGQPATGPATVETETLPDGKTALAVAEFPNAGPYAITAYSFSLDQSGRSACTGPCAVEWVPVLTNGQPQGSGGVSASQLGVIRRPDGTDQVTYNGKPLYLYTSERFVMLAGGPQMTGTVGNGNGLSGPGGGKFSVILPS